MEESGKKYIRWSETCVWQTFGSSMSILKILQSVSELASQENTTPRIRLNQPGKDVWELCDGTRSVKEIVHHLLEEYEGDPETISKEVREAISELEKRGFLTEEDTVKPYTPVEILVDTYVRWDDMVMWNEVEGKIVVMNNKTSNSLELPETVGEVWLLCDGKKTVREIFSHITAEKNAEEQISFGELKLSLKQLIKLGMLTLKDAPS